MAHTVAQQRVSAGKGLGSRDSSANIQQNGSLVLVEVDITNYPTNGETINAHEFGMSVVYNCIGQTNELDDDVSIHPVPSADGKTVLVHVWDGTSEEGNGTDIGNIAFLVTGEPLGQE
jgi:hypothetical protein